MEKIRRTKDGTLLVVPLKPVRLRNVKDAIVSHDPVRQILEGLGDVLESQNNVQRKEIKSKHAWNTDEHRGPTHRRFDRLDHLQFFYSRNKVLVEWFSDCTVEGKILTW